MKMPCKKKYIDAEAYSDCRIVLHNEDQGVRVKDIPPDDVEEVRHGEWKCNKGDSAGRYYCSLCFEYGNPKQHYCGYCGAKMDGGLI